MGILEPNLYFLVRCAQASPRDGVWFWAQPTFSFSEYIDTSAFVSGRRTDLCYGIGS